MTPTVRRARIAPTPCLGLAVLLQPATVTCTTNATGSIDENFSFIVRAAKSCGAVSTGISNRVAELDVGITPGVP